MANWLNKLLGIKDMQESKAMNQIELMSGLSTFTPFTGDAYENDLYRSAVDAIARNTAKLRGKHLIYSKATDTRGEGDSALTRILQTRPNQYMSAYDLIYKLITHYYLYNNAFAYLQKDNNGNLKAIYPLSASNVEYITDTAGEMYLKFLFSNGSSVTLHYSEVFIMRRFFNSNDLLGDSNNAILSTLELAHTQSEGLTASIKNGAKIKGILKYNQVIAPDKLKAEKDQFMKDYMSLNNHGGVVALDSKADYTAIEQRYSNLEDAHVAQVKGKIYSYLGISQSIVDSTYTEDEWSAFYESVIEPLALQMSLEFTNKLFTEREQSFGNKIVFESNRLQFASNQSKANLLKELVPLGLLTINQALEILNLPPVEDGNKRVQTLNVVNTELVDQYQMEGKTNERD